MGEAVVFNFAKALLQPLSSLAKDEFLLLWTSKRELDKLCKTVDTIKAVVEDAERQQATNPAVATWLARLRDEIYNIDDFFDRLSTKSLQRKALFGKKWAWVKQVRLFFSRSHNHLGLLVSTAHTVKDLRGRLKEIADDMNQFGLLTSRSHAEDSAPRIRREEHSYVKADDIIGRNREKARIVNDLLKADEGDGVALSIITIFGIGGSGKTALAQLVFNQRSVQRHFDLCLWACVNSFSDLNVALEKIVACGTEDRCEGLKLEQLQKMLREMIGNKKYLLVLDDVWDEDVENWRRLKHLLDAGKKGSKILVTTRLKVIAQNLTSSVEPLYLEGLSDTDAWSLFKKVAFDPNQSEKIQRMETIGRRIVKMCANVPLAIRIMGSFLRNKDETKWACALNYEISDGHDKIMQVLRVSYNDLSLSLKHCFAYCSLFPKDYVFYKDELIRLWMAQGFLQSSDHKRSLEDIGDDCFTALLERCFFQDVKTRKTMYDDVVSCKMHDLLHDLAVDVSGKECIMVESMRKDIITDGHRHVSYNCDGKVLQENPLPLLVQMERLRTFFFHQRKDAILAYLDGRTLQLRCLRVLDLSCLNLKELPGSVGKLVHLRHLDLSWNQELIKLPTSVCKLQKLLTLKLKGCRRLKGFPTGFKLLCLRHLDLDRCTELARMPSGLKEMTCLVMLRRFVVHKDSGGLRLLRLINDLRGGLRIQLPGGGWKDCVADAEASMLRSKTKLIRLNLQWSHHPEGPGFVESDALLDRLIPPSNLRFLQVKRFPGTRISNWVSSLGDLIDLEISDCLSCVELSPLRQLNSLKRLTLCNLPLVEYMEKDNCYDTGSFFGSLETLYISDMPNLKGWWRQGDGMSVGVHYPQNWFRRTSKVSLRDCPNLTDLPFFPYVEHLTIKHVNEKLLENSMLRAPPRFCLELDPSVASSSTANHNWCRLKHLHILNMECLISLPDEWADPFSTLLTLSIVKCPKLKSLSHQLLCRLAALEALEIQDCKEFCFQEEDGISSWALFPTLGHLILGYNRNHLLMGLHNLTSLQRLDIWFDSSDEDSSSSKPVPWMLPPNLKDLHIGNANTLILFSESFRQLGKLEVLKFRRCEVDEEELKCVPWEALKSLGVLTFSLPKVKALPEGCQSLPALHNLEIIDCFELKSLPEWVARLNTLRILQCGEVSEKYKNLTAPCCSLIRHIPDVQVW